MIFIVATINQSCNTMNTANFLKLNIISDSFHLSLTIIPIFFLLLFKSSWGFSHCLLFASYVFGLCKEVVENPPL